MASRLILAFSSLLLFTSSPVSAAGSVSGLDAFYAALYATEIGTSKRITRISWWGDSAVASDGYTGALRALLQRKFGDGGPGFLLIDPTYKGYYHKRVRMRRSGWKSTSLLRVRGRNRRMGLAGMVSQSYGGASTTYISKAGSFRQATLFYRAGPRTGDVQIYVNGAGLPLARHSTRADNRGSAIWRQDLPPKTRQVRIRAVGKGSVWVYGLVLESAGPGVVLDTLGMVGLRARGLGRLAPKQFERQLSMRRPDLTVIHFGGNERVDPSLSEARHAAEVERVVKRLRKGAPKASCMLVGPLPHGRRSRGKILNDTRLEIVVRAQRKVAARHGCAYFDAIGAFGGEGSAQLMRDKKWLVRDLAHLSPSGEREVARRIDAWLVAGYTSWKKRHAAGTRVPGWEREAQ